MRKVTEQVCSAFLARKRCCVGNTATDGTGLWLHGNLIAEWLNDGQELWITTAGWNTVTTRDRLNGLPCRVHQRKGLLYLNGEPWDGKLKRIK